MNNDQARKGNGTGDRAILSPVCNGRNDKRERISKGSIDYAWDDNGKNVAIELYERESKTHSKSFERTLRMRKKAGSSCYVEKVLIWENSTSLITVDR